RAAGGYRYGLHIPIKDRASSWTAQPNRPGRRHSAKRQRAGIPRTVDRDTSPYLVIFAEKDSTLAEECVDEKLSNRFNWHFDRSARFFVSCPVAGHAYQGAGTG